MKLTEKNLKQFGWLFTEYNDMGIMVREHECPEAEGGWEIELDVYKKYLPGWEATGETYAVPSNQDFFLTVEDVLRKCPELKKCEFIHGESVIFT